MIACYLRYSILKKLGFAFSVQDILSPFFFWVSYEKADCNQLAEKEGYRLENVLGHQLYDKMFYCQYTAWRTFWKSSLVRIEALSRDKILE
jgi:hypothetical protein